MSHSITTDRSQMVKLKYGIVSNLKSWRWMLLHFVTMAIFQLTFPTLSEADFKFCHVERGPHRILESDCPGGFIAFEPLNTSCLYYAKGADTIPELKVTFSRNMCDNAPDIELYLDGDNDFSGINTFHSIFFEVKDEAREPVPGIEVDKDICTRECLSEWKNPFIPDDDPKLVEVASLSEAKKLEYEEIYLRRTKELFMVLARDETLFDEGIEEDSSVVVANFLADSLTSKANNTENSLLNMKGLLNIIKLFIQSARIIIKHCDPFIERNFYTQVIRAMIYFHGKNPSFSIVEIDSKSFKKIAKILEDCEAETNTLFLVNGTICYESSRINAITNLKGKDRVWSYRRQSRSFRWGAYDPIVESAWVAFDFTHNFCFESFDRTEEHLHFHLYTEAMRALFPPDLLIHWMYPAKLKNDDGFWNTIMDTTSIKNQMRNLDACATAAAVRRESSPYNQRLLRPFVQEKQLENPSYKDPNKDEDHNYMKSWTKSVSNYWKWYDRHGGFKEISKFFGYCLDGTAEYLEKVEETLKEKGLSC